MAGNDIGYDTAGGVGEADWAELSQHLGTRYATVSGTNTRVVVLGSSSMTVSVGSGITYGFGVYHNVGTSTVLPIAPVTLAGAVRWDAVIERRDWSNNTTSILLVPGVAAVNAAEVNPSGLTDNPGILHDQVLALVKATNGSTSLLISDKRIYAHKHYTFNNKSALPVAKVTLYGATAYIVSERMTYRCLTSGGNPAWLPDNDPIVTKTSSYTGTSVISAASGWTLTQANSGSTLLPSRGFFNAETGIIQLDFQLRRTGGTLTGSSTGNITDTALGTITPTVLRPDVDLVPISVQFAAGVGTGGSWLGGQATLAKSGAVNLVSIAPNADLGALTSGASLRLSLTFCKNV